jgi:hypothetical protein
MLRGDTHTAAARVGKPRRRAKRLSPDDSDGHAAAAVYPSGAQVVNSEPYAFRAGWPPRCA